MSVVLSVRDLHVDFPTDEGILRAVDGVGFDLLEHEVLGVVGESGCGKTVTMLAILGLLPSTARVSGEVRFRGRDLLGSDLLRDLRGSKLALIFQDALAALNPVHRIGDQIAEAILAHNRRATRIGERVRELLDVVGIPDPYERGRQYPHEFSAGMRQRAMIAMAIANEPDVIIADEPTTALDVTIRAQVLDVLARVQERSGSSIILITHDLGMVAGMADRVLVMYAGRVAELGTADAVFYEPGHPYSLGLLSSIPRLDLDQGRRVPLHAIPGQPPSLVHVPPGCAFHPRCRFARADPCQTTVPELRDIDGAGHRSACHFAEALRDRTAEP